MTGSRLQQALAQMASLPGVGGCAIVEADTGMVWESAGELPGVHHLSEAVSDYWRLFLRRSEDFAALGELRAQVLIHSHRRVTLVGCGEGLVLVTVSGEPDQVRWADWKGAVGGLQQLVASM
ncbi:hypothetical protein [Ramlibacter sp.]|uniref:hypothetical protein n=1 Tax=Ramlibacter sp. TaxID=1917967 RepID=UPI0035AF7F75